MKNIYIVRHGQTDYNNKEILQGSTINSNINEKGKEQSKMFFDAYKHVHFDKIYTSKLKRSVQSVQSFLDLGIEHESFYELNEINWGIYDGKKYSEVGDYFDFLSKKWSEGKLDLKIEGGESPIDLANRQKKVIDSILSDQKNQHILICTHGRALSILVTQIMQLPLEKMSKFRHSNLCLYKIHIDDRGKPKLVIKNDTKHLDTKNKI